jgi:hypothetical protein
MDPEEDAVTAGGTVFCVTAVVVDEVQPLAISVTDKE